jgi:hypothetical protein
MQRENQTISKSLVGNESVYSVWTGDKLEASGYRSFEAASKAADEIRECSTDGGVTRAHFAGTC